MGTLLLVLDLIGTFVFALSGATAGVKHRLDLFGVLVLSYAAGINGAAEQCSTGGELMASSRFAFPDRPDQQHGKPYSASQARAATIKASTPILQGRMDNRRKARTVIGRDLVESACSWDFV